MTALDHIVALTLSVVLIIGGYQFYFWAQRRNRAIARALNSTLDNKIPLLISWIWVYSGLYYPLIVLTAVSANSLREFCYVAFSYFTLLTCQMAFFLLLPIKAPDAWRAQPLDQSLSAKLLNLVRKYDGPSNAFPSMHVSVATLTALHLSRTLEFNGPILPSALIAAISFSCLVTKQHYLIDVPLAIALGWANHRLFLFIYSF